MSEFNIDGTKLRAAFSKLSEESAPDSDKKPAGMLGELLAAMRTQAMHYQHAHWQCQGPNYYGDHLLFERLYGSLAPHIDGLAEKIVGYYGPDALSFTDQAKQVSTMATAQAGSAFVEALLRAEEALQTRIDTLFKALEASKDLPLGMNDFLAALANDRDTAVYLLKQRSRS